MKISTACFAIGAFVLLVGGFVASAFVGRIEYAPVPDRKLTEAAACTLLSARALDAELNGKKVRRYDWEFELDGEVWGGHSFGELGEVTSCTVVWPPGEPERARLQGTRTEIWPQEVMGALVVPLGGFGLIGFGLWYRRKE